MLRCVGGLTNLDFSKECSLFTFKTRVLGLLKPWRWRKCISLQQWELVTPLYSITFQMVSVISSSLVCDICWYNMSFMCPTRSGCVSWDVLPPPQGLSTKTINLAIRVMLIKYTVTCQPTWDGAQSCCNHILNCVCREMLCVRSRGKFYKKIR